MKYGDGRAICESCHEEITSWLEVEVILDMEVAPDPMILCCKCFTTKEFYFIDEDGVVRYNRVTRVCSSVLSREIFKKKGERKNENKQIT